MVPIMVETIRSVVASMVVDELNGLQIKEGGMAPSLNSTLGATIVSTTREKKAPSPISWTLV